MQGLGDGVDDTELVGVERRRELGRIQLRGLAIRQVKDVFATAAEDSWLHILDVLLEISLGGRVEGEGDFGIVRQSRCVIDIPSKLNGVGVHSECRVSR